MAHYVFGCKNPCVPNAKAMQTHKYVHIRHNISTPKFECPAKNLIFGGGGGGGGVWDAIPPTTTPKFDKKFFLSPKSQIEFRGGAGGGGGF